MESYVFGMFVAAGCVVWLLSEYMNARSASKKAIPTAIPWVVAASALFLGAIALWLAALECGWLSK